MSTEITRTANGQEYAVTQRYNRDRFRRTSVVYVSGQEDPDMERPPFGRRGDVEENDRLWRKYNRMEVAIMRRHAAAALGLSDPSVLKFSRRAGCSCGCSPGFRIDPTHLPVTMFDDKGVEHTWATHNTDIWVQVVQPVEPTPQDAADAFLEWIES